jgi:hypothetical protein
MVLALGLLFLKENPSFLLLMVLNSFDGFAIWVLDLEEWL